MVDGLSGQALSGNKALADRRSRWDAAGLSVPEREQDGLSCLCHITLLQLRGVGRLLSGDVLEIMLRSTHTRGKH